MAEMQEVFSGVYKSGNAVFTDALVPGSVYGEELRGGRRYWNPYRSKLSAAILKGLDKKAWPLKPDSNVLYLGASTGTTVSHVSDIVRSGQVYALEFSEVSMRKLLELAKKRKNVVPLLQDAKKPADYQYLVGDVDAIYQDVAQPDQAEILSKNAKVFLKPGAMAVICVKARSIDTAKDPAAVFKSEEARLGKEFDILQKIALEPFDKDHMMFFLRYRG